MTEKSDVIEVRCESCGARLALEGGQRTVRCPFCDAPSVVTLPIRPDRPRPVFVLGFLIEREAAADEVRRWIRHRKMAPFGLRNAVPERITGIYLPAHLYSATARSEYQVSIAESYRKLGVRNDSDGGVSLGSRDETEWRDLAGRHVAYVADILVTASRNITNDQLEAIEPFDLTRLQYYSPALIAGWSSEEPSLTPEGCVHLARTEAQTSVGRSLAHFMPGDGHRSLDYRTDFAEESIDLTLVPVWVFALRHDPRSPPVRILVNGQTGRVGGAIPFSWAKLGLIVAGGFALVAALMTLRILARLFP